jgi:hypothetical protein
MKTGRIITHRQCSVLAHPKKYYQRSNLKSGESGTVIVPNGFYIIQVRESYYKDKGDMG